MTDEQPQVPADAITIKPTWFNILASHDAAGEKTIALALDSELGPFFVEVPVDIGLLIGTSLVNGAVNHAGDAT